jgi:hypothetical protein
MMGHMTIPRLIHWWWDGPPLPDDYARYRNRWVDLHPEWRLMIWNEETFRLNFEHHPVSGLYFERMHWSPRSAEWGWKTNIARYLILQRLGGLWVDADLEPLHAIDPLIEPLDEAGGSLAAREDRTYVNNAFLATPDQSAFISAMVDGLPARVRAKRGKPSNVATGPHYLTEVAAAHPEVTVLPPELIYPMHWSELGRRGENFPGAYTLHHWHRKTTEQTSRASQTSGGTHSTPARPGSRHRIKMGAGPGGEVTTQPAVRPDPPATRRKRAMPVPNRIRKTAGLTPEPVAITLADLAAQVPADRAIVELGVYQGRTLLYIAWGARQGRGARIWGIDPWDLPGERGPYTQNPAGALGKHRKAFTDPGTRAWARYNVKAQGFSNSVRLVQGFSAEQGRAWSGPPVGMLFVDGDHRYDAVREDLAAWAPHLARDAEIAFDDYVESTHPEVVRAVDDMVTEGLLEPVLVFHDRLAVTRLGSGHPVLVHRELERVPAENRAEEARQELVDAIKEEDLTIDRGGPGFPLPDAIEGDSTEREHPGTGEPGEAVEAEGDQAEGLVRRGGVAYPLPPGTEEAWQAGQQPAGKADTVAAGKAETVPMAEVPPEIAGKPGVDADPNIAVAHETVLPGEIASVTVQTTLGELNVAQLRELAQARRITLGRDRKTRDAALAALRAGR